MNARLIAVIAVLLALAAGGTIALTTGNDKPQQAPQPPATATPVPVPGSDLGSDLRAEPQVPGKAEGAAETRQIARGLTPRPSAARIAPDCKVDYGGHVYSDRSYQPTMFVLHYTVSHNTPGWGDVYAIRDYFERTRVGSAHFILDFEGHCLKMVPGDKKAWTQGNANSASISVEIIAYGNETRAQWRAAPIFKDRILAGLARSVMDSHGFPLRRVDPVGCVFPSGWTDHDSLECGNDHHDVRPSFPYTGFGRQLKAVG